MMARPEFQGCAPAIGLADGFRAPFTSQSEVTK